MPYRKVVFAKEETYHVFNQGITQQIFFRKRDYLRFLLLIDFYRFPPKLSFSHWYRLEAGKKEKFLSELKKNVPPLVEVLAFCLMPNHFHFLLKQLRSEGISKMIGNLQNSYARYFNLKNERVGPLFQPMFKAVRIQTEEQLIHVSRYIHLNPSSSFLVKIKNLGKYPWSSLQEYLGKRRLDFVKTELITSFFKDIKDYKKFVFDQAEYQRELQKIKQLILE